MILNPTHPGLVRLDQIYQQTCASFDNGELSAVEARTRILNLSHTDSEGRTWRIDTKRSGRHAAFKEEIADQIDQSTNFSQDEPYLAQTTAMPVVNATARHTAVPTRQRVERVPDLSHQPATNRKLLAKIAAKGVAVIIMLVAILAIVITDDSPTVTVSATTIPVVTIEVPVAPQTADITSFFTKGEVPFDVDIEFGRSVRNEPLLVHRRGVADGVSVLVIGVIHGDEDAGLAVLDELRKIELDTKIDLWLVPTMNPDGQTGTKIRQNANGVDLNRNFPTRWRSSGTLGYWEYSGPSAASEPEVQAMVRLGNIVKPQVTIWYHQDYFRINPGTGRDGAIRKRYASLAQLPLLGITGGTYTGTAAIWSRTLHGPDGISLTVEFGPSPLRVGEASWNANAVLAIVREFFQGS